MNVIEKNPLKRAVIYCRVSTKEQVEEGNSLVTQERLCREYARKNGYEIAEVFIEQGESAKTVNRTQLLLLLSYCKNKANRVNTVITYKIDRISRNTDGYSEIRILLKKYGVEIKSISENFENNPVGRFLENTMASIAQLDNDIRTERSVGGMREAMREGRYVWMASVGYKNVKIGGKATITQDERLAPLVRKAFALVATNTMPIVEVRRKLIKEGFVNPLGKPYAQGYFFRMLTNKLYTGWIYKFGEKHKGLFEPIVSEELFEQVQRVLKHKGTKHIVHVTDNPDFPLRRFVFNECGKKITGSWSKGHSKKYPFYTFAGKGKSYRKADLEQAFMDFMDSFKFSEADYKELLNHVEKHFLKSTSNERKEIDQLNAFIKEMCEKQNALINKNINGVIPDAVLTAQLELIDKELLNANARLAEITETTEHTNLEDALTYLKDYLKSPSDIWAESKIDRRLKLQWFQFPKGVTFDGKIFRTTEVASFFKAKMEFLAQNSPIVNSRCEISNKPEIPNTENQSTYTTVFWQRFRQDVSYLYELFNTTGSHS